MHFFWRNDRENGGQSSQVTWFECMSCNYSAILRSSDDMQWHLIGIHYSELAISIKLTEKFNISRVLLWMRHLAIRICLEFCILIMLKFCHQHFILFPNPFTSVMFSSSQTKSNKLQVPTPSIHLIRSSIRQKKLLISRF